MFLLQCFFVFTNCIYSTVKLVKCCLYVCYVQIKTSHLLRPTYFILPDIFTADYDAKQVALKCRCQGVSLVQSTLWERKVRRLTYTRYRASSTITSLLDGCRMDASTNASSTVFQMSASLRRVSSLRVLYIGTAHCMWSNGSQLDARV